MKISKLRFTGLSEGNSSVTGEFPAQSVSNAENASIWWRHHVFRTFVIDHVIPWCDYHSKLLRVMARVIEKAP